MISKISADAQEVGFELVTLEYGNAFRAEPRP